MNEFDPTMLEGLAEEDKQRITPADFSNAVDQLCMLVFQNAHMEAEGFHRNIETLVSRAFTYAQQTKSDSLAYCITIPEVSQMGYPRASRLILQGNDMPINHYTFQNVAARVRLETSEVRNPMRMKHGVSGAVIAVTTDFDLNSAQMIVTFCCNRTRSGLDSLLSETKANLIAQETERINLEKRQTAL